MDAILRKRLEKFEAQIEELSKAEGQYRTLEAAKEHTLAKLELSLEGDSQAARRMKAYASTEWVQFNEALSYAETEFNKQKHILELKRHAFQAEYLSLKMQADAISKQV